MTEKKKILPAIVMSYLLCFLFRLFEYFVLRTDQTVLGEAFVHKLIGIAILIIAIRILGFKFNEVGFVKEKAVINLLKGLGLGVFIFAIAYAVEIFMSISQGNFQGLELYVSAYAVDGNIGNQTAFIFFLICIAGNIINVVMEEGIFRGLFWKILEERYSFIFSAVIASGLFGVWHVVAPVRNYYDGTMSLGGCIANIIMLVVTSTLVGFKFAMLTKMTGSLYMAMGDHFVNNTIVNMLHVVSSTGADGQMVVRIAIAQSVSFVLVLVYYIVSVKKAAKL